jgi:hypothetical protein
MIEQGTPPKRLQSLMGHKAIAMTMDIYGHLFPAGEDETTRADNAVASVLTGSPEGPGLRDITPMLAAQNFKATVDFSSSATNRIGRVDPSDAEGDLHVIPASAASPSKTVLPIDTSAAGQVGASASQQSAAALRSGASEDGRIEHFDLGDATQAVIETPVTLTPGRDSRRTVMNKPAFYECEVCGFFHPEGSDCAVENRLTPDEDLDERYGDGGWVEIDPPASATAAAEIGCITSG